MDLFSGIALIRFKEKENCSREISMAESKPHKTNSASEIDVKAPNIFERAKEEIEAIIHIPRHHTETHGTSDDINESTSIDEVRGPGVFERVKEEIEAIVEAIHPKKDENNNHPPSKEMKWKRSAD